MSEQNKKPVGSGTEDTGKGKKPAKEKKEFFLKRWGRNLVNAMHEHPFWTAFGGAAIGSGLTIGAGEAAKKIANRKQQKTTYIPQDDNSLDPNM